MTTVPLIFILLRSISADKILRSLQPRLLFKGLRIWKPLKLNCKQNFIDLWRRWKKKQCESPFVIVRIERRPSLVVKNAILLKLQMSAMSFGIVNSIWLVSDHIWMHFIGAHQLYTYTLKAVFCFHISVDLVVWTHTFFLQINFWFDWHFEGIFFKTKRPNFALNIYKFGRVEHFNDINVMKLYFKHTHKNTELYNKN